MSVRSPGTGRKQSLQGLSGREAVLERWRVQDVRRCVRWKNPVLESRIQGMLCRLSGSHVDARRRHDLQVLRGSEPEGPIFEPRPGRLRRLLAACARQHLLSLHGLHLNTLLQRERGKVPELRRRIRREEGFLEPE